MAGAKNKKQRKALKKFLRERRKNLELKHLLRDSASAKQLVKLYDEALKENKP